MTPHWMHPEIDHTTLTTIHKSHLGQLPDLKVEIFFWELQALLHQQHHLPDLAIA